MDFSKKFPDNIKLNLQDKNVGMMKNLISTLNMCENKYIAICEGDDYWTDSHKLQKQVDFLEQNSDYSLCFHSATILEKNEKGISIITVYT